MRLTIYIDSNGRIIPANNISAPARAYPICVEKKNRKLLDKLPSQSVSHCGSLGIFSLVADQKPGCILL